MDRRKLTVLAALVGFPGYILPVSAEATIPENLRGLYVDEGRSCFGGMRNKDVVWFRGLDMVPPGGLVRGDICQFRNIVFSDIYTFQAKAVCKFGKSKPQIEADVKASLHDKAGYFSIVINGGVSFTKSRRCLDVEISSTVGQNTSDEKLTYGEKTAFLLGYYKAGQVPCGLPAVSSRIEEEIGRQIGGMMARDLPGRREEALGKTIAQMKAGSEAFEIDGVQMLQEKLCKALDETWRNIVGRGIR